MHAEPYELSSIRFAYCYHAYLRWSTHRLRPHAPLAGLTQPVLAELVAPFNIHVLECTASPTDVRLLVSLKPEESISSCASKLKGKTSRWLRESLNLAEPTNLLSKGYFACTSGKSTTEQVEKYLNQQGEHHGYAKRVVPPVFVQAWTPTTAEEALLSANHAFTRLDFHCVLATWRRHGVFGAPEGKAVSACWRRLQSALKFALLKVSFVADHVHLAVRVHPGVAPGALIVSLMNQAQHFLYAEFPQEVIRAGVERLWQPSVYVGSHGDLASPQIQKYVQHWQAGCGTGVSHA
ncbi:MAG TPA: IS200/IS605 family transposase [Gemmataceae bacterium]|jgi:REP element-mobilizing transposase RayT|nr:IS200/IS605 family transposase [Gemmataceae bacterium]